MQEPGKPRPSLTERARAEQAARAARQADALRANLRKRKQQARERARPDDPSAARKD